MSRSYKHTPILKQNKKSSHEFKKLASRRFRRQCSILLVKEDYESLPIKSRELSNPYSIHDYTRRWTLKEAIQFGKNECGYKWFWPYRYTTEEEIILDWKKEYYWK